MKLCVLANLYAKKPLDEALATLKGMGVEAVEIGCGGYPGKDHAAADFNRFDAHTLEGSKSFVEGLLCVEV